MRLSPAQLSALLEGLDWGRVHTRRVSRPRAAGHAMSHAVRYLRGAGEPGKSAKLPP